MKFQSLILLLNLFVFSQYCEAEELKLSLRYQTQTSEASGRFHTLQRAETWDAGKTALIVCDVWDSHNCWNAVQRVNEMAPRLNQVVQEARRQGVVIIHAPSDCMDFYKSHPARRRAESQAIAADLPDKITQWCTQIPAEEKAKYPIDQTDGGCDDTPEQHSVWEAELVKQGRREKKWPWKRQTEVIEIDEQHDYISDKGDEIWSVMESRGIENVILTGVHTNMCVLGRPFGLRQMAKNGKNVALLRDMTDTMYNPASAPYVSHFTGTDLIVSHIEKYVCPTFTSDQLIGGEPFRFQHDKRPHLALLIAEDEYQTEKTLPPFAIDPLGKAFRISLIFGSDLNREEIPGLEVLTDADLLLVSVRRHVLPEAQMKMVKEFVASGKPVVGIRTSSHAFSLRDKAPPEGLSDWTTFDADVFGGNYHGHHKNELVTTVTLNTEQSQHSILQGIPQAPFTSNGSLYQTVPLKPGTTPLLFGKVEGAEPEPLAWTFIRSNGGRSFYTSLGHIDDFQNPAFQTLLTKGIRWALEEK